MEKSNNKHHRIYVASSWRNEFFPEVIGVLRKAGHVVYDFRHPSICPGFEQLGIGGDSFKWSNVSANYTDWTPEEYRNNLKHPLAEKQFGNDLKAMDSCDTCVLVLPCGRSAHTEAGWFAGKGRNVIVYMPVFDDADLMYKLFNGVACNVEELVEMLRK